MKQNLNRKNHLQSPRSKSPMPVDEFRRSKAASPVEDSAAGSSPLSLSLYPRLSPSVSLSLFFAVGLANGGGGENQIVEMGKA